LATRKDNTHIYIQIILTIAALFGGAITMLAYFQQANIEIGWRIASIIAYSAVILITVFTIRRHIRIQEMADMLIGAGYIGGIANDNNDVPQPRRWWHCKGYR
jgi:hypothetical protein